MECGCQITPDSKEYIHCCAYHAIVEAKVTVAITSLEEALAILKKGRA